MKTDIKGQPILRDNPEPWQRVAMVPEPSASENPDLINRPMPVAKPHSLDKIADAIDRNTEVMREMVELMRRRMVWVREDGDE